MKTENMGAYPLCAQKMDIFSHFSDEKPGFPFVAGQLGQSLDGRIATLSGDARDIGGSGGLMHLHNLRAHVDAVVVGAATILADDPQLNVRLVPGKNPARVVIDPRGRIDNTGKWLTPDGARRILVTTRDTAPAHCDEFIKLETHTGVFQPEDIISALYQRGMKRILIEGGAMTLSRFIDAHCLDRLHIVVSPLIIGSGKPAIDLKPVHSLTHAMRPQTRVFLLGGGDVLFDCDMRSRGTFRAGV